MKTIVVAVNQQGVLGKDNTIPWHNSEDLTHFKNYTMGKDVIMGRKTFESIGKPLPGRKNIIVTSNDNYSVEGAVVVHGVNEALEVANTEEVIIGGGANIYKQFLDKNLIDKIVMSIITTDEINGGVMFPELIKANWRETSFTNKDSFSIKILERMRKQ